MYNFTPIIQLSILCRIKLRWQDIDYEKSSQSSYENTIPRLPKHKNLSFLEIQKKGNLNLLPHSTPNDYYFDKITHSIFVKEKLMHKSRIAALIITSMAINYSLGVLVTAARLPIFVDSVGTVLAAIMGGFVPSLVVGVLTLLIRGVTDAPVAPAFAGTAILISGFSYLVARRGLFGFDKSSYTKSIFRIVLLGVLLSPITALSAAPVAIYAFGGIVPNALWSGLYTFYKFTFSLTDIAAGLLTSITVEPIDKIPTLLLAAWIANSLPKRLLANYPNAIRSLALETQDETVS